jgi:hypothetical protein
MSATPVVFVRVANAGLTEWEFVRVAKKGVSGRGKMEIGK